MVLQRKNLILIVEGMTLLLLLFFIFLIFGNIREEKDLVKQNSARVQEKEEEVKILENLKLEYIALKEEIKKTDQVIAADSDQQGLMSRIEGLATKNGLILESIDFSPDTSKNLGVSSLKILGSRIKLFGLYPSLKNFISDLENNLRLIDVYNFKILNKEGGVVFSKTAPNFNQEEIISFELKLNSYFK